MGPEWTREQCQWSGAPHSPKLQLYWHLTIRWFSVTARTLTGVIYSQNEGTTILAYKNRYYVFTYKWVKMAVRETDRQTKDLDCYHWHHIKDIYSEPCFFNGRFSARGLPVFLHLWALADCSLNLLESLYVSVCWLWISSLYNIFNAHTFSFRFPIYMIHFHFSLFTLRHSCNILFKNSQVTCCQRSICNTSYPFFQNVHLWTFSSCFLHLSFTSYKKYIRNNKSKIEQLLCPWVLMHF